MGMQKTALLALLAVVASVPASAQTRAVLPAPALPSVAAPPGAGAAASALAAPTLPSLSAHSFLPTAAVLPAARASLAVAAPAQAAEARALPAAYTALEAAAKPFADEAGRSSPDAAAKLALTFDASMLARADEAAAVIPGTRHWPRVAGAGLARPYNGVSEDPRRTPAPKKGKDGKEPSRWEKAGTGVMVALLIAGGLAAWFAFYSAVYDIARMGEQQIMQSVDIDQMFR